MADASTEPTSTYKTWRLRGVVAWAIVGAIAVFVFALTGLSYVDQAVELLFIGAIVGYVCSPVTNWLEGRRVPRALAALLSLVLVLLGLALLVALFVGPFLRELMELLKNVPSYIVQLQEAVASFWENFDSSGDSNVQNVVNQIVGVVSQSGTSMASDLAKQISTGLMANISDMAEHIVTIFLGLILAYWLALDYPKIMRELARVAGPKYDDEIVLMLAVLSRSVGGYMTGQLITSLANGAMVALGLLALGHPYAGLLGIATFVLHFVPVIGPFLSSATAIVLALIVSPACAFWTLVLTVVAQNVADNVLSPLVMRSSVKIHPALSLVGIIIGNCLGGAVGMVLAIPLTAAAKSFFVYWFEQRTGRQLVSEDGALFAGHAFTDAVGNPQPSFDALDDSTFIQRSLLLGDIARLHEEGEEEARKDA